MLFKKFNAATEPPSDFIQQDPSEKKQNKMLIAGCGGCAVIVLIALIFLAIGSYRGCKMVGEKMDLAFNSYKIAVDASAPVIAALNAEDYDKVFSLMAPPYQKRVSKDEFISKFDKVRGHLKNSYYSQNIDTADASRGVSRFNVTLIFLQKPKTLHLVEFYCIAQTTGPREDWACPLELRDVRTEEKNFDWFPSVKVASTFIQDLQKSTPEKLFYSSFAIDPTKNQSSEELNAFITYAEQLKKTIEGHNLDVVAMKEIPDENNKVMSASVDFADQKTHEKIVTIKLYRNAPESLFYIDYK